MVVDLGIGFTPVKLRLHAKCQGFLATPKGTHVQGPSVGLVFPLFSRVLLHRGSPLIRSVVKRKQA
jgi:hypothetical protein